MHGLHRAEAVQPLQLVSGESVDGLQEGVVGELEGWVQGDRSVQGFAPHLGSDLCRRHGDNPEGNKIKYKAMRVVFKYNIRASNYVVTRQTCCTVKAPV